MEIVYTIFGQSVKIRCKEIHITSLKNSNYQQEHDEILLNSNQIQSISPANISCSEEKL